ncbi:hypothetical protein AB4560_06140 [Vibrio sp. 10N.222.51.C12]|uniref:hypothetical protein n=1 Tax=Vibrio sp. 10N.222.51.C12 TaxID=3229622 RepID=UPI003553A5E5
MLEQQFREECAKQGVDIKNLNNDWAYYQAVYLEMTQNGEKEIKVTDYYNRVSGQYHIAKAAFNILKCQHTVKLNLQQIKPVWFQQFVANITSNAEAFWHQIDEQMSIEVARKVECAEAAMRRAEHEHLELGKYLDDVSSEKAQLEESVNTLIGYRDKNEQLLRSIDSKCEHIRTLEERLNYANVTVEKYDKQREQLNQLQIEHAQINTELVMRNEQLEELKNEVQWLRERLSATSKASSQTGNPPSKTSGDLFIESIQNGEE